MRCYNLLLKNKLSMTQPNIYIYIYIYVFKISSQCPNTMGVDYSLHRIYEENHINL